MTRHPAARRVHRQDTGGDDAFVTNVLESSVWAREHARTLTIAAIVVVVAGALAFFYLNRTRSREEKATTELTPIRAIVQNGNVQQAIPQLESYVAAYGGTHAGLEARLMLGQEYLITGQPKKTLEVLEPIGDDYDNPAAVNAANLQAAAYEAAEEPHRAEQIFLRLGDEAPYFFQQQDALDNVARIRLGRGDAAGAVQIYQRLYDATPADNNVRQIWQLRLAEAKAAAAAGKQGG